ncbi:MAG: hypothetical protein K5905_00155 [Roseibium sp.]|uniref:hypothetical protein n=1 Tax=Roseibium sp. TaxID=1936156 RepID=UPI00263710B2|nr:hypothetical protein [Roseibium sp.]MCV0423861.1 hypothetical protein [Roseibium sp.]
MFSKVAFEAIGQVTGPEIVDPLAAGEKVFLFDLDVLVASRFGRMDHEFAGYVREFARSHPCYLLTSANYSEVMSRLPGSVRHAFEGVFASCGTELWVNNEILIRHEHLFSDDLYEFVAKAVQQSAYSGKEAPLLECGSATLRLSLAGIRSTAGQQMAYRRWEREHRELDVIADEMKARFPDHTVCRDSDISLMITPNTFTSARVHEHILKRHKASRLIAYFANRSAGGFAKPLCDALLTSDVVSTVNGPSDVSQLLSYEMRSAPDAGQRPHTMNRMLQEA